MKWCLCLGLLVGAPVFAQVDDPTRPPAESMSLPTVAGEMRLPAEAKAARLESVVIGRNNQGREIAVIDGKIVRLGEKYDGAVLVRVTANTAVLRRGKKEEVLHLFPPINEGKSAAAQR